MRSQGARLPSCMPRTSASSAASRFSHILNCGTQERERKEQERLEQERVERERLEREELARKEQARLESLRQEQEAAARAEQARLQQLSAQQSQQMQPPTNAGTLHVPSSSAFCFAVVESNAAEARVVVPVVYASVSSSHTCAPLSLPPPLPPMPPRSTCACACAFGCVVASWPVSAPVIKVHARCWLRAIRSELTGTVSRALPKRLGVL